MTTRLIHIDGFFKELAAWRGKYTVVPGNPGMCLFVAAAYLLSWYTMICRLMIIVMVMQLDAQSPAHSCSMHQTEMS